MSDYIPNTTIEEESLDPISNPTGIFEFSAGSDTDPYIRVKTGRDFIVLDDFSVGGSADITGGLAAGDTVVTSLAVTEQITINGASRIFYTKDDAQTFPDADWTTVEYDDMVVDNLGEFASFGFTPEEDGYYIVTARLTSGNVAWTVNDEMLLNIYIGAASYLQLDRWVAPAAFTGRVDLGGTAGPIPLTTADTLYVKTYINRGAATDSNPNAIQNYIMIHRQS